MSLNPAMIYRRTDRGVREVYEKSHQFTQSERLILILLDGRLNVSGLQARLPSLNDERIERAMGKLQEAGLVEPMGSMEAIKATGLVPEIARLEPEAVAHFLEQTDLDPVTVFGATEEEVASELVRASVEKAAAQLARESAAETIGGEQSTSVRNKARHSDSVRSHSGAAKLLASSVEPEWDATEATRFAITTVNVPDRLDLQEERDRAEMEEYAEERRRVTLRTWMKRLLVVAVIAVFGAVLYGMLKPLRDDTSAARVGERLTAAFKRPVTVADTAFQITPTPRLVIRGVDVAGQFVAEEVSLLINWKDLWSALRGGQWVWGEATIAPMTITAAQAMAALKVVPGGARELPNKISTVRFESIRISNSRLFPGQYEGVLRRTEDGKFGPLTFRQQDADGGAMQMQFRPAAEPESVEFTLAAERWAVPVGPRVRWNEVRANGQIAGNVLEVSNFSMAGFFGVTTGTVFAASDVEWVITGFATASNIDVEAVLQTLRPRGQAAQDAPVSPLQGTAALNLTIVGRGASLDDALGQSAIAGPFQMRWATLNGINLGLAATQGATAAGITRFTEFDGALVASATGVRFEDVGGRAGAMAARGDFTVSTDHSLNGGVRVELGGQSVQAPINLRIGGTALDPRFGK
ncbi:MAG: hypothetical protein ACXWUM_07645 [Burkholderiaceae bacterium]